MKILPIIKYLSVIIGTLLLALAVSAYQHATTFQQNALTATGTVREMIRQRQGESYVYSPIIEFTTQKGRMVDFISSESSKLSDYDVGDQVDVLYEASAPEEAIMKDFFSLWGASIMFAYLGGGLFLFGIIMIVRGKRKAKKIEQLLKTGRPVEANFTGVHLNKTLEINGKHPFRIHAQWQDPVTQEIHLFTSDNLWFDPTNHISTDIIKVFINKAKPKQYHMDTDFLPKLAK